MLSDESKFIYSKIFTLKFDVYKIQFAAMYPTDLIY